MGGFPQIVHLPSVKCFFSLMSRIVRRHLVNCKKVCLFNFPLITNDSLPFNITLYPGPRGFSFVFSNELEPKEKARVHSVLLP